MVQRGNPRLLDVDYNTESSITFHVRLLFFDFEYLDAPVGAAGQAHVVRQYRLAALRTAHQLSGLEFPVGAPLGSTGF
jgi:hypothetical protein